MKFVERRKEPRILVKIHFFGITKKSLQNFYLEDFSTNGLKLKIADNSGKNELNREQNLNILMFYKIESVYGEDSLKIMSEIRWHEESDDKSNCVGVRFLKTTSEDRTKISDLVTYFRDQKIKRIDCIVEMAKE